MARQSWSVTMPCLARLSYRRS